MSHIALYQRFWTFMNDIHQNLMNIVDRYENKVLWNLKSRHFYYFSMRQDVFDNLVAVENNIGGELKSEAKRFVEKLIKLGKRNGKR